MFPLVTHADSEFVRTLKETWGQRRNQELSVIASHFEHPGLVSQLSLLNAADAASRSEITTHPLFTWCVNTLVKRISEGTDRVPKISEAITALRVLILDGLSGPMDTWVELDALGRISFPFSAKVVSFGPRAGGTNIHVLRNTNGYTLSVGDDTISVPRASDSLLRIQQITSEHMVQVWHLPTRPIVLDSLTTPFVQAVSAEWSVAPPSPTDAEHWVAALSHVREVLDLGCDSFWEVIRQTITVLVPLSKVLSDRQPSCSFPAMPGVIGLSLSGDPIQLAEAIIRQSSAILLSLAEKPLIDGLDAFDVRSPWRVRPTSGVALLRHAFADAGVADLWRCLLKAGALPRENPRLAQGLDRLRSQVSQALDSVCANRSLTPFAEELIETIRSSCAQKDRPLPVTVACIEDVLAPGRFAEVVDDRELLKSIIEMRPTVGMLAERAKRSLRELFTKIPTPAWLRRLSRRTADVYFLRWCLPLAELAELPFESLSTTRCLFTHTQLGLLWRYLDVVLDHHDLNELSAIECYEASLALIPGIVDSCDALSISFVPGDWRFLTYFTRYNLRCERMLAVRHQDIWKRGTPFFLIPRELLRTWPDRAKGYKEYMNLLGILDDVVDVWEDIAHRRRTWTTETLLASTAHPEAAVARIRRTARAYTRRLKRLSSGKFPILDALVRDAWSVLDPALATLADDLRSNAFVSEAR